MCVLCYVSYSCDHLSHWVVTSIWVWGWLCPKNRETEQLRSQWLLLNLDTRNWIVVVNGMGLSIQNQGSVPPQWCGLKQMTWLPGTCLLVWTVRKTTASVTVFLGGDACKTLPQSASQVWNSRSVNAGYSLVHGQFWWHFDLFRLIRGVLWRLIQTGKRTVPWSSFLPSLPPSLLVIQKFFFFNWSMWLVKDL